MLRAEASCSFWKASSVPPPPPQCSHGAPQICRGGSTAARGAEARACCLRGSFEKRLGRSNVEFAGRCLLNLSVSRDSALCRRWRGSLATRIDSPGYETDENGSGSDSDKDTDFVDMPLWKRASKLEEMSAFDFDKLDAQQIQKEAQRLATKQAVERISNASYKELFQQEDEKDQEAKMTLKEAVDKVLIADFFLITLSLMWFLTGVLQQSISKDSSLLDGWIRLWVPLFQPAIGIFMAAAAISAFSKWLSNRK